MSTSVHLEQYVVAHGPQQQRCNVCNAVHAVSVKDIALRTPGVLIARLSAVYAFPEYEPYRVGCYRIWFVHHKDAARVLGYWDGKYWRNGPVLFQPGSIYQWQGLGGDMEHTKRMPYEHDQPFPFTLTQDESCD